MSSEPSHLTGSNKYTSSSIHVALAADNNYFEGLLVTAWSIARNCRHPERLAFHILDGGISPENVGFLDLTLKQFNCSVNRIPIDQSSELRGLGTWHGNSRMTFARLLLPTLLPDIEHIVYSDVDFIWFADITSLWELRRDDLILQYVTKTVKGFEIGESEAKWAKARGCVLRDDQYFCAGMLLMNLRRFRNELVADKLLKLLLDNGGTAPFCDQTVLNMFMLDRTDKSTLPENWQVFTCDPESCVIHPNTALHFAGDTPWKSIHLVHHLLTDFHIIWHRIHAQIRGITTWQSLRMYNTPLDIVACRLLYLSASRLAPVRSLLRLYLKLTNRASGIYFIEAFMKKQTLDQNSCINQ